MKIQPYIDSLQRALRRPEIRRHPIRTITRRLAWRRHWQRHPDSPIVLKNWWRNLTMTLPHTSNASLLFYRTHSDPSLASLLQALLSPGMTFLDVGAHIGEYTLIGAHMVGPNGRVVAVEPLSPCVETIRHNAALNGFKHVSVLEGALCHYSGRVGFLSDPHRSAGWIAARVDQVAFETQCWTLSDLLKHTAINRADVVKIDASGNELSVLRGGEQAILSGAVGRIVMKLYHPAITRERFNYDSHDSVAQLAEWGMPMRLFDGWRLSQFPTQSEIDLHYSHLDYAHLLLVG